MNIGVIGSGNVGGTLGGRWARNGHEVTFSSREPNSDKMKKLVSGSGPTARAATLAETIQSNDVLLLSTPWAATRDTLARAGNLNGKILIDAVNAVRPSLDGLELGNDTSVGEKVAEWAPGAKVVKAFNTIGSSIMADANLSGHSALMFYCGDDAEAKRMVHGLASELGFDAEDAGGLKQSRLLESLALLWITLAFGQGYGREFAFKLIRR